MVWAVQYTAVLLSVNLLAASNGSQLVGELHRRGAHEALSHNCQGLPARNNPYALSMLRLQQRSIGLIGTCLAANYVLLTPRI